jgi:hypothetical protein
MSESYSLILAFDSDDPEFCRGFEAGHLWERIQNDHTSWDSVVHATNAEMVMRMCEAEDRGFRSEDMDDDFVQVWIT